MKKLFVITGLIMYMLVYSNTAMSRSYCFGVYVSATVVVCYEIYLDDNNITEKCAEVTVTFCRGIHITSGTAGIMIENTDPSIIISQDIIVHDFEFEDGSVSDIIIPAGEEATLDESSGEYITNYYIYNN